MLLKFHENGYPFVNRPQHLDNAFAYMPSPLTIPRTTTYNCPLPDVNAYPQPMISFPQIDAYDSSKRVMILSDKNRSILIIY